MIKKNLLFVSLFLTFCAFKTHDLTSTNSVMSHSKFPSLSSEIFGGAYLTFAEKFGGTITNQDLQKTQQLGVAGCAAGSKITSFTLQIKTNGTHKTYRSKNHVFSKELTIVFRSLKKGDSFEFKNVKAKLPTGGIVDVYCKPFVIG